MQILNSNKRTASELDSIEITSLFDAQKKAVKQLFKALKHGTPEKS